jgi:hypothetical protein
MATIVELQSSYTQQIIELKQMVSAGELSESEYNELIQDMLDVEKIESKLDTQEDIIYAKQALEVLATIAKMV